MTFPRCLGQKTTEIHPVEWPRSGYQDGHARGGFAGVIFNDREWMTGKFANNGSGVPLARANHFHIPDALKPLVSSLYV